MTANRFSSASKISINSHSVRSMYQNAANYFRNGDFLQKLQHFDFYLDLPEKRGRENDFPGLRETKRRLYT